MRKGFELKDFLIIALVMLVIALTFSRSSFGGAGSVSLSTNPSQDVKAELESIKTELEEHRKVIVQLVETLKTSTLKVDVANRPSTIKLDPNTQVAITSLPAVNQAGEWAVSIKGTADTKETKQKWSYLYAFLPEPRNPNDQAERQRIRNEFLNGKEAAGWELVNVADDSATFRKPRQ